MTYERSKFWMHWGYWQIITGIVLFLFCASIHTPHYKIAAWGWFIGLMAAISGVLIWSINAGNFWNKKWNDKYENCPHCGGGGWVERKPIEKDQEKLTITINDPEIIRALMEMRIFRESIKKEKEDGKTHKA